MTADLVGARSAVIGKLAELALLSSTETSVYTPAGGTGAKVSTATLTNTSGSPVTVSLSIVKSGGTAGPSNRTIDNLPLGADGSSTATVDLGALGYVGDGDFVSAKASASGAVSLNMTGVVFSSTAAAASGIQDDAIGSGGRTVASSTVTGTNLIGTNNNRYLLGALMVSDESGTADYNTYTTLSMSCTFGPMTKLASVNFNAVGSLDGSLHFFGIPNPTSGSNQTLTGTAIKAGITFDLTMMSMSLSGISSSFSNITTDAPSTVAALNLPVTSAVGHRVFYVMAFDTVPQDFQAGGLNRVRGFNGSAAVGFSVPHWMLFADAPGAGTVIATTSNTMIHAAIGMEGVPA